ncbi:MAG: ABC transporter substrate-binding protein [Nitrospirae bacterium]|nr:ABC transporter substrate-binding protein [Nitrospirota bacterium]
MPKVSCRTRSHLDSVPIDPPLPPFCQHGSRDENPSRVLPCHRSTVTRGGSRWTSRIITGTCPWDLATPGGYRPSGRKAVLAACLTFSRPLGYDDRRGVALWRSDTRPALIRYSLTFALFLSSTACTGSPWNNPYPASDEGRNILYSSFEERPKHLDPAQSYSSNEVAFTGQIYEPPLQYHYLLRPYTLIPLTATEVPHASYFDAQHRLLPDSAPVDRIAYSVYEIHITPGIRYQPHPAFAKGAEGRYRYHELSAGELQRVHTLADFPETDTRELLAEDYVYQIKRLAHPRLSSPIFGLMSEYIVGLREYGAVLEKAQAEAGRNGPAAYLDLTRYPLEGAVAVDRYTYRITVRGKYPQLVYWLAMPFFAPMPPEVDRFYSQPGLAQKNITLDWYPVGTGPYMLTVNNPNRQMVLERNPNFHGERYPTEGESGDRAAGLLTDAGKPLPFVDKAVYSLEKETIPYWNKFLQGYYDATGISSDSFDQAVRISGEGEVALTDQMETKGIRLVTSVETSSFYLGFNMLDPVVGGYAERAGKLRQAISIAFDDEEFISIFRNGRGTAAQGPIPPGIFGYVEGRNGINPYVYDWVDGRPRRKPIDEAKRLLAEAGYPNGRDATGKALVLHFDVTTGGPEDKFHFDWIRKQFAKLNLELEIRDTDYNRFQDKMQSGAVQLFQWGWNADYPDPENFLFLLYGPNAKVGKNGENAANYHNPEFDRLFERVKNMDNSPERQGLINQMVEIARHDAPWGWGYHPKQFTLHHAWYKNAKPNLMANNTLKYRRVEPRLRAQLRAAWNHPKVWPVAVALAIPIALVLPALIRHIRRERGAA